MVRLAGFVARNAAPQVQVDRNGPGGEAAAAVREPGETPEAQEARLVAQYQAALLHAAEGSTQQAVEGFQAVLSHPLLAPGHDGASASRGTLRELRLLATRNLADQLGALEEKGLEGAEGSDGGEGGGQGSTTARRLQLYGDAVLQQHADAVQQGAGRRPTAAGTGPGAAAAPGPGLGPFGDTLLWQRLADVAARDGRQGLARYALEAGLAASGGHHVPILEKLLQLQLKFDDLAGALGTCRRLAELDPYHPWLQPGAITGGAAADGGDFAGGAVRGLQAQLLRFVDPRQALLEEFLERQRLEQQYVYGYGYGPPERASADGDGGDLAAAAAAVAAAGLPPLEAPALEGRLPEGPLAKRRRLGPAEAERSTALDGTVIELEVPVAGYAKPRALAGNSPHSAGAGQTEQTAWTGAAEPDLDGTDGLTMEPLYDSIAVLTSLNRLLRGLPTGHGGAADGAAAASSCGAAAGATGGTSRLLGAVLRLTPASPRAGAGGASATTSPTAAGEPGALRAPHVAATASAADATLGAAATGTAAVARKGAAELERTDGSGGGGADGTVSDGHDAAGGPEGTASPPPPPPPPARAAGQRSGHPSAARGLAAAMAAAAVLCGPEADLLGLQTSRCSTAP